MSKVKVNKKRRQEFLCWLLETYGTTFTISYGRIAKDYGQMSAVSIHNYLKSLKEDGYVAYLTSSSSVHTVRILSTNFKNEGNEVCLLN